MGTSVKLQDYIDDSDPTVLKLSVKNNISDGLAKSFACIIPFLINIEEVEFKNNAITDGICSAIVMACFANSNIKRITLAYNFIRDGCGKTIKKLNLLMPE